MLETIQNAITPESETGIETQSITTQADDSTFENQLTVEIKTLWSDNVRLSSDRKATAKELRQIRASLAERLYAMKSLLSRPGRGGQWRSWLKERGIPRSSADRLCDRHAHQWSGAGHSASRSPGTRMMVGMLNFIKPKKSALELAVAALDGNANPMDMRDIGESPSDLNLYDDNGSEMCPNPHCSLRAVNECIICGQPFCENCVSP